MRLVICEGLGSNFTALTCLLLLSADAAIGKLESDAELVANIMNGTGNGGGPMHGTGILRHCYTSGDAKGGDADEPHRGFC